MYMMLWNLFIIYVATNVEWLFALFYKYFLIAQPGGGVTPDTAYLDSIKETAVFAVVFYALTYAGLIRIRSAFGLFLAVVFSDIAYYYIYRPAIDLVAAENLQDSYGMRLVFFIIIYAIFLILLSAKDERAQKAWTSWFPSDERVYAFFKNFFNLYIVGLFFVGMGVLFIEYTATLGIVPAWSWQVMIFTIEAVALPMTGFIYLLYSLLLPDLFGNDRRMMAATASAYGGFFVALLPISLVLSSVSDTRISTLAFLLLAAGSLYGGTLTYLRFAKRV